MDEFSRSIFSILTGFIGGPRRALSPAGRLLDLLDAAERAIKDESHITDELRCALRRADILASRHQEPR